MFDNAGLQYIQLSHFPAARFHYESKPIIAWGIMRVVDTLGHGDNRASLGQ